MFGRLLFILLYWLLLPGLDYILAQSTPPNITNCQQADLEKFVKVRLYSIKNVEKVPLYASAQQAITIECIRRCGISQNCDSVLVDYSTSSCYRLVAGREEIVLHDSLNYFTKICISAPHSCEEKLWVGTIYQGQVFVSAPLLAYDTNGPLYEALQTCLSLCLSQEGCRSTSLLQKSLEYQKATCQLFNKDATDRPDAFRASDQNDAYIESHCISGRDALQGTAACGFEEFPETKLPQVDRYIPNISIDKCEERCMNERNFPCKSFNYENISNICTLSSESSVTLGPSSLIMAKGWTFKERAACLNVSVSCDANVMEILYYTTDSFGGRIYVTGHSKSCSSEGKGQGQTKLVLPIRTSRDLENCGLTVAQDLSGNRSLIQGEVIIQQHPIIQTRGDRALKVGCLVSNATHPSNVVLHATINFGDKVQIGTSKVVVNSNVTLPKPTLRVLLGGDMTGQEIVASNETRLGQPLILVVETVPPASQLGLDIRAVRLIAMSNNPQESYMLLDSRGCPADLAAFPEPFQKQPDGSLRATFRAFKFPTSDVVTFSVTVQFCEKQCTPVVCTPKNRNKRSTDKMEDDAVDEIETKFAIIVKSPVIKADSWIAAEDAFGHIITLRPAHGSEVCLHYGWLLGIAIIMGVLQVLLLVLYYHFFHWRRFRVVEPHEDSSTLTDKHVRWADTSEHSTLHY